MSAFCFYTLENISTGATHWVLDRKLIRSRQMACQSRTPWKTVSLGESRHGLCFAEPSIRPAWVGPLSVLIQ